MSTLGANTRQAIAASSNTIVVEWPRDESLDIARWFANRSLEAIGLIFDLAIGIPNGLSLKNSYIIYRNEVFVREIEIPTSLALTVVPPFLTLEQDSSKLNHFFIDTGLKPNTTYSYRVAVNSYAEYGPYDFFHHETDNVMTDSATTWSR